MLSDHNSYGPTTPIFEIINETTNNDESRRKKGLFSHLVELLEEGGELPAGRAPVGGEVEADEVLVGQRGRHVHGRAVGLGQGLALQELHLLSELA